METKLNKIIRAYKDKVIVNYSDYQEHYTVPEQHNAKDIARNIREDVLPVFACRDIENNRWEWMECHCALKDAIDKARRYRELV